MTESWTFFAMAFSMGMAFGYSLRDVQLPKRLRRIGKRGML
jgi:hypothetical protein